jgi:hypothetical protein
LLHASFIAVTEAFVYREPVAAFDAVLVRLPYATRVQVAKRSGRFVQVAAGVTMGWVDADSVASGAEVLPQLKRGVVYDAASTEAVRLRTCIADSFNGRESGSMLTGVEYVTYRLWQQARVIPWPVSYGRVAGTWQRKLRGVRGVHIDVMPRTGAIMEYILDEVGYLAYVEAVSPDLRIRVTGIGLTHEGQYTEQVFEHGHWRELHPVFIQV